MLQMSIDEILGGKAFISSTCVYSTLGTGPKAERRGEVTFGGYLATMSDCGGPRDVGISSSVAYTAIHRVSNVVSSGLF